jgi:hypothetical protein
MEKKVKENKFHKGDKVRVMDEGLLMLQRFAPPGAKPNNEGIVSDIWDDGTIEVEFPLDGDNHSQVAPYPPNKVVKI